MQTPDISTFGLHSSDSISSSFRICVWNVHNCLSKKLPQDIKKILHDFDIVLMQEAVSSHSWDQVWNTFRGFHWGFFRSFSLSSGNETGILTGSRYTQKQLSILPTTDREPLLGTPKASGISLISITGQSEQLLVVNTHAMNFNLGTPFLRQIHTIYEHIRHHNGPILWAGDFNTWSKKRLHALERIARSLGLEWIIPENDRRILKLDHILYRGVRPRYAEVRHDIRTSDHYPIIAEFEIVL